MSANIVELFFSSGENYLFINCNENKWYGKCFDELGEHENYNYSTDEIVVLSKNAIGVRVA